MNIGFTGTQVGMTPMQFLRVAQFIAKNQIDSAHSGDCIGADKEFHELILLANNNKDFPTIRTVGHIPDDDSKRAFCKYDYTRPAQPYIERNHSIVNCCDYLIATPKEKKEKLRSGTWATVRYAKKIKRAGMIVFPDGSIESF